MALATLDGSGNYSAGLTNLPAGTYTITARYAGDGTYASSLSTPVQVTVSSENSAVTIQPNAYNTSTCVETPAVTFTYGAPMWTDVTVAGASGHGVPTGTVPITDNANPLFTTSLNPNGVGHMLSGAVPISCLSRTVAQDTAPLATGTHVLGATYSGDGSFPCADGHTGYGHHHSGDDYRSPGHQFHQHLHRRECPIDRYPGGPRQRRAGDSLSNGDGHIHRYHHIERARNGQFERHQHLWRTRDLHHVGHHFGRGSLHPDKLARGHELQRRHLERSDRDRAERHRDKRRRDVQYQPRPGGRAADLDGHHDADHRHLRDGELLR